MQDEYYLKKKKLQLLKAEQEKKNALPHLYGQKFYPWSREFFESTNKYTFLCAANQIGKSSIQIRKMIHWATEPSLWPKLWGTRPLTFWYLYPTFVVASGEFEQKWVPNFMPRGTFESHPQYGWEVEYARGQVHAVHFKTGVSLLFKSYATDVQNLQTGTSWYTALDEELPEELFDELNLRIAATNGYLSMAFTATMGQEFWRRTIEERGAKEKFRDACKIKASMYDCLTYEDGTPSHWTQDRIKKIELTCRDDLEVQVRVHGKFAQLRTGLRYGAFIRKLHVAPGLEIPSDWFIYSGVDIGSGGDSHPATIVFVGVSPDFKRGRVFRGWCGHNEVTTVSDIIDIYRRIRGNMNVVGQFYDWASKDFLTITNRMGETFISADKRHDVGEQIINALFRNGMLTIDDKPELSQLADELETVNYETKKNHAKDDMVDALRYAVTKIPWDWSSVGEDSVTKLSVERVAPKMLSEHERQRRGLTFNEDDGLSLMVDEEIASWNELYEP